MSFLSVESGWVDSLVPGVAGIPEPEAKATEAYSLDQAGSTVAIVPGLAFDRLGSRLGRGKGYYDRFLGQPECTPIVKIGVCFEIQMHEQIPVESFDIPMDWIVTEEQTYRTGFAWNP